MSDRPTVFHPWRCAPLLLAITMLFWAGNSVVGRAMVGIVPPVALAFWRWTLALALVTPLAWPHLKRDHRALRRSWKVVVALSATGVACFGALLYVGVQSTTALNSILLQAAIPPLILLFAWVGLGERTGRWQVLGVVLSLLGVLVIITQGKPWRLLSLRLNQGDLLVLLGVVLYAIYSLILRARPQVHPLSLLWATFLGAMVLLAPFLVWETASGRLFHPSPAGVAGIAYVAVLPSFMSYLFFNRGVELIGAGRAGQYLHLVPVFGSVLAVLLLGEAFHAFHAVGVVLIGAGILVASRSQRVAPSRKGGPIPTN